MIIVVDETFRNFFIFYGGDIIKGIILFFYWKYLIDLFDRIIGKQVASCVLIYQSMRYCPFEYFYEGVSICYCPVLPFYTQNVKLYRESFSSCYSIIYSLRIGIYVSI